MFPSLLFPSLCYWRISTQDWKLPLSIGSDAASVLALLGQRGGRSLFLEVH